MRLLGGGGLGEKGSSERKDDWAAAATAAAALRDEGKAGVSLAVWIGCTDSGWLQGQGPRDSRDAPHNSHDFPHISIQGL